PSGDEERPPRHQGRDAREEVDRRVPQGRTRAVRAARARAEAPDRAGWPQAPRDDAVAPASRRARAIRAAREGARAAGGGSEMRKVAIFDTTLRDGEQAPGASLSAHAKFLVAKAIADLGVDVLEAGFPAASVGEAEAVASIAREVRGPTMAALARASGPDVETAAKSLAGALRSRIHVFIV